MLAADVDLVIPAAVENVFNRETASAARARLIVEAANGPTLPDADPILQERGILVIPDILCNAGGVFVSYLEYTQETQQEQMSRDYVNERLDERMSSRFADVHELAGQKKISMRAAALYMSVERVCEAVVARGALP